MPVARIKLEGRRQKAERRRHVGAVKGAEIANPRRRKEAAPFTVPTSPKPLTFSF
jgi:hypothetical protein